jgi:hypothetical protein
VLRGIRRPGGSGLRAVLSASSVKRRVQRRHIDDAVNALPKAWADLQLVRYEDISGIGDWQQTREDRVKKQLRIVRMLARKR